MRAAGLLSPVRRRLAVGTRLRRAESQLLATRYARWRTRPVRQRAVLYESFSGNGMLDNPEALFRYLLAQHDMADLEHIWALNDLAAHPEAVAEFADDPRVRFVRMRSPEYFQALATAKFLVNNATFPQEFAKRPEQVYLNTWHGVPLKHMGFDMPGGGPLSRNVTRNFLNADYLVSANQFMTDTMYRRAFRLQGIFRGGVIEEGQPRTDRQVQALESSDEALRLLEERGVRIGGRKVLLYAPTWRGESFQRLRNNAAQLVATVRELQRGLADADCVVLLKVHQVVYDMVRQRIGEPAFLVPNSIPTNVVLAATDVLVTDFSSIVFDFVATGRPVVHHVPDFDDYRDGRGLYLDEDDLPGPRSITVHQTLGEIRSLLAEGRPDRVRKAAARFAPKDDGRVCERIVDLVFRGHDESRYTVHRDFGSDKETMLIYLGSMKSQGITTSALNLLHNIDYDRYDVTAFFPFVPGADRAKNMRLIDDRVRVLPRASLFIGSPRRVRAENRNLLIDGLPSQLEGAHRTFWTDEWQRVFGAARFQHLVDFSGYGSFAPFLYSVAEAETKSIWLHGDMYADMQRETVGQRHLQDRLQSVFSTYRCFDQLVSVSPALDQVNRTKLARYADPGRFTYALNTIDGDRVLRMAGLSHAGSPDGVAGTEDEEPTTGGSPARLASFDTDNLAAAVTSLLQHYPPAAVIRETRSRSRFLRAGLDDRSKVFVSVGRLSPEKNHARLVRAFAQVHEDDPDTRLVIMGGGKLEGQLRELILSLGLESAAMLTGQVENPYPIMAEGHCFVLSSDYEGQPMVILEARTLGLPIITTAFTSVGDSVPEGAGLVVPQTEDGLAEGMRAFLAGKVPSLPLDPVAYNAEAMRQFEAAIHRRR